MILLLAGAGVNLAAQTEKDPQKANEAFKNGDFELAAEILKAAIEQNPEDARLYFNLGNALAKDGKMEQAEEAYRQFQLRTDTPQDQAMADYNLGTALTELGELEDALSHLQNALAQNPEDEDARVNYEIALKQLQDQEQQQQNQDQQNQDQQQDQQQNQDQQQQNQDQQNQDQQQDQQQNQDQQQQSQQQDSSTNPSDSQNQSPSRDGSVLGEPKELTKLEAKNLLQALEQLEKNILKNQKKAPEEPATNEKDW